MRDDGAVDVVDLVAGVANAARGFGEHTIESAPLSAASVSGKWWPMSPSAAAPSSASVIDAERIDAELSQGVLRVRIPKAAHAQPRRISVAVA